MQVGHGEMESVVRIAAAMEALFKESFEAMEKQIKRMAEALKELMHEYIEYIEKPEIPSFMVEPPYFKKKFNAPKQTYFPKVRATARSNC